MALIKTKIPIPLTSGINTKVDDKQLSLGSFSLLENVNFDTPGKFKKRTGYDALRTAIVTGGAITQGTRLAAFKEELCLLGSSALYSYIESQEKWSSKGGVDTAIPDSTQVLMNNKEQSHLDAVHVSGLNLHVYADADGVHLSIMDNSSKSFILSKFLISATGISPKIVSRDNEIYCLFIDGTNAKYRKFDLFDYNNIAVEATVASDVHASNKVFDAIAIEDRVIFAYSNTANVLSFRTILNDDTLSSITTVGGNTPVSLSLNSDRASRFLCAFSNATDVKVIVYNYTFAVNIVTVTVVENISNVVNATIAEQVVDGTYDVVYEISDTNTYDHYVKKNNINLAATVGTASNVLKSIGLASKPFWYNNKNHYLGIHDNTLQSTYFVFDVDGSLVSKINPNTAGDVIPGSLSRVTNISDSKFLITSQIKGQLTEENGTFFSLLGVNETSLEFAPAFRYKNNELANNMHIAGGFLKMYDGSEVVEHGFHLFPEGLAAGTTNTTTGFMSDGAYEYVAVYEWIDAQGNKHKSAQSLGLAVTLSGGGSTQYQDVDIPTLRLTEKTNVIIEVYRTEASGTIFYKVTDLASPVFNDKTADIVTFKDTVSDADLIDNEILYTTGGVLDNIAAPSSSIIESFKTRIFTTTTESNKLNYSKIQFEGFPVEFNDSLEIVIPSKGGDNSALKAMDDKLIIFKNNAIYYLSGDGPNNLGAQDTFIEPELIIGDLGCTNPNSIVLTTAGIAFKSNKGIYLLDRSLSLSYVGQAVEAYNHLTITNASVIADKNQILFTTSDGVALLFNYNVGKWGTYSNHTGLDAVVLENVYHYLKSDGTVYRENNAFNDNGSVIKLKAQTGWMAFNGAQTAQRVYRMLLLGSFKSAHKIRIKIAYDFKNAWVDEQIIDTADFIEGNFYGSSDTYGSDTLYGGDGDLYQVRVDFSRQKCQAIKISIEDLQDTPGEALDLSNLLLVVGSKATEAKIDEGNGYGTS